jgi:small subunit ribosomal protein S17
MRIIYGKAVSTKMDKTVVVRVDRKRLHSKYKKAYSTSKKYFAHDPEGLVNEGDMVYLKESRPMSKLKKWVVISEERALKLKVENAESQSNTVKE